MASSSSKSSEDPTSTIDLATLISKGRVQNALLKLYAEKGLLDIPDKDGRTPLMTACWRGHEDTVKLLLANGANPNTKCLNEGNTPMHYACIVEGWDYYHPSLKMTNEASKIAIIKLLLSSGGLADQENLDGWTPPCFAALCLMTHVVDLFWNRDDAEIPLEMKIKITEILGVSQALGSYYGEFDVNNVFCSFSQAIDIRKDAALPEAQLGTSELVDCFNKVSLKECQTSEEIKSIKESELGLKAHAFLVGDRVFSKKLKQMYFHRALVTFGCYLLRKLKMVEESRQVLFCAIGFEHRGESKLGLVVKKLAEGFHTLVFRDKELLNHYLLFVRDLLCEYESVLNHVHIGSLSDHCNSLLENFGEIVFCEAFYCSTVDILLSTLQIVERLVRMIRGRICKENPEKYDVLSSVTFKVMDLLTEVFLDRKTSGRYVPSRSLLRVKFVIRKILFFDNNTSNEHESRFRVPGDTLHHLVAHCVSSPRQIEHLEDLALAFVRHGCPINEINDELETPMDALQKNEMYDPERYPRLLTLVSPPTTVLTLEELAIRQILRNDISYLGEVPTCLYGMIRGGLKDSDLERANEAISDEEME